MHAIGNLASLMLRKDRKAVSPFGRMSGALLAVICLAACAAPAPPISIRPGIGQAANLDAVRPPSGVNYRYALETDGVPVPVELQLRSKRRGAKLYDYTGTLNMTLPQAENLEEIGKILAQTLKLDDLNVDIRGNMLRIPVSLRTDNRFRSTASNLVFVKSRYIPHDCFAVIGTCRYTATEGKRSIKLIAETSEKDGVWRTTTRPDPKHIKPGQRSTSQSLIYSIDKNAVLIDMVLSQSEQRSQSAVVFRRK